MGQKKLRHSLAQAIFALFAANPRLLVPAEWHICVIRVRAIHPYRSRMQLVRNLDCASDIPRKYRGGQAIQRVVRLAQYVFFILKLDDDANWPENLFLDDAHVWPSVREDSRLDPEALRSMPLASKVNLSALLLARIDVTHNALHHLLSAIVNYPKRRVRRTSNWIWDT